jgi:hypothetical protein
MCDLHNLQVIVVAQLSACALEVAHNGAHLLARSQQLLDGFRPDASIGSDDGNDRRHVAFCQHQLCVSREKHSGSNLNSLPSCTAICVQLKRNMQHQAVEPDVLHHSRWLLKPSHLSSIIRTAGDAMCPTCCS